MALARVDADVTAYTVRRYQVTEDKVFPVSGFRLLSLFFGPLPNRLSAKHQSHRARVRFSISSRTFAHCRFFAYERKKIGEDEELITRARASANPGRSRRSRRSGENGKSRRGPGEYVAAREKREDCERKKEAAGSREKEKIRANVKKRKSKRERVVA